MDLDKETDNKLSIHIEAMIENDPTDVNKPITDVCDTYFTLRATNCASCTLLCASSEPGALTVRANSTYKRTRYLRATKVCERTRVGVLNLQQACIHTNHNSLVDLLDDTFFLRHAHRM
jgi:hypothetical protein